MKRLLPVMLVALLGCAPAPTPLEIGGSSPDPTAVPSPRALAGRVPVVLARVAGHVDGDTLKVSLGGRVVDVRIIGVDTPERGVPFFGDASAFTARAAPIGATVYLERDVEPRDTFDRALYYVWLQRPASRARSELAAKMLSARLVARGLATVLTIPPNVRYADHFVALQRRARERGLGLWSNPALATCDPSYVGVCIPPPPPDLDCADIDERGFIVRAPDPHRFDADGNGRGCEGP